MLSYPTTPGTNGSGVCVTSGGLVGTTGVGVGVGAIGVGLGVGLGVGFGAGV